MCKLKVLSPQSAFNCMGCRGKLLEQQLLLSRLDVGALSSREFNGNPVKKKGIAAECFSIVCSSFISGFLFHLLLAGGEPQ